MNEVQWTKNLEFKIGLIGPKPKKRTHRTKWQMDRFMFGSLLYLIPFIK